MFRVAVAGGGVSKVRVMDWKWLINRDVLWQFFGSIFYGVDFDTLR